MAKIPAAQARLFKNIFVCKNCKAKIRTEPIRVITGKVRCRKCKGSALRPIRKK
jgi:ribosomal protein L40E